jgi:hypothetical protein
MDLNTEHLITVFQLAQEAPVQRLGNAPPLLAAVQHVADYLNWLQAKAARKAAKVAGKKGT